MPIEFMPKREADLVTFTSNFSTKISAAPEDYALTAAQATAYATLQAAFAAAYQTANDPSTRTPSAIIAKDDAKNLLIANTRELSRIVQAAPNVSNEQKSDLGLTVRDVEPTPVPVPGFAPSVEVKSVRGRDVEIRLWDAANPTNRGRPAGVQGAAVFSYVGAVAPTDPAAWKFEGNTTRTTVLVEFPATVADGAQVWITAFWFNPRAQSGPGAAPVGTNLQGGAAMAA